MSLSAAKSGKLRPAVGEASPASDAMGDNIHTDESATARIERCEHGSRPHATSCATDIADAAPAAAATTELTIEDDAIVFDAVRRADDVSGAMMSQRQHAVHAAGGSGGCGSEPDAGTPMDVSVGPHSPELAPPMHTKTVPLD